MSLTWKDVFNSDAAWENFGNKWGHIDSASSVAYQVGYRYFSWNGRIYEITRSDDRRSVAYVDTGLTEEDLE